MHPISAALGLLLLSGAARAEEPDSPGPRMFERMKTLTGEWEGTFDWTGGRTGSGTLP